MALAVKNPPASVGDVGSMSGLGRSPGGGHGNSFQYSCLENLMDRGVWWATVIGSQRVGRDRSDLAQSTHTGFKSVTTKNKKKDILGERKDESQWLKEAG